MIDEQMRNEMKILIKIDDRTENEQATNSVNPVDVSLTVMSVLWRPLSVTTC